MQLQNTNVFGKHEERVLDLLNKLGERNRVVQSKETVDSPFASLLADGVGRVNSMQHESQDLVDQMLTGGDVNQAEVFTSVQKADMSFRLLVSIRNKLMQAYEELNSIRV